MSAVARKANQIPTVGMAEHVAPSNAPMPSRIPVMANLYTSNEHFYAKRSNPVPQPVSYSVNNLSRVNKFQPNND